jgi:1-phosphatidylinositol-4-phosphate 5-kinase
LTITFCSDGSKETEPHKTGLFKFRDYCPLVFQHLRQKFGIDPADYLVSLCNTLDNGDNALRLLPTPGLNSKKYSRFLGKSGSLFFFSHDMKYIVKTVPKSEASLLLQLLPDYYKVLLCGG